MRHKLRIGLVCAAVAVISSALVSSVHAGQMGGSILYSDHEAATQRLDFRMYGWKADGYFRAVVDYREAGSVPWLPLDENWGWTERSAIAEITKSARYLARDGNIWRFVRPGTAPPRAVRLDFGEGCWRSSLGDCRRRLAAAWARRSAG